MDSGSACTGDVSFDDGLGLQLNITTLPQSNIELSTLKMDCDTKGLFTNDVSIFWGLWHPLVLMSAYHQHLACPLVLQIDDVICEQPWTKNDHF